MFVDGRWTSSLSGETFTAESPATGEMIAEVPNAGREDAQCAKIHVFVSAQRARDGGARLGERGRVDHDRVEPLARALDLSQVVEHVGLDEPDVRQVVARRVRLRALQRIAGHIDGDDALGASREVQRERAVIAEAVEGAPARAFADHQAILALVEKRARFLSRPRSSGVAHAVLVHLDFPRNVPGQELDVGGEGFLLSHRNVVAGENAGG